MAATSPATLIDVVVLVFARSDLKNLVGTDALRTVLSGSQRALFPSPGTMSLQPVWELIESQPGFDAEQAIPPMCRLKTWENQLKIRIEMPTSLADLDLAAREKKAFECNVGDDELNKVLKLPAPVAKKEVTRAIESSSGPERTKAKRSLSPKIAIVAAVLGLAAAGISIYLTLGRREPNNTVKVAATEISADLPMRDVRRNGKLVVGTLTDAKSWLAKSEFLRRQQLEAMVPKLKAQQATGLMLMDSQGQIVATLKLDRVPPVVFPARR